MQWPTVPQKVYSATTSFARVCIEKRNIVSKFLLWKEMGDLGSTSEIQFQGIEAEREVTSFLKCLCYGDSTFLNIMQLNHKRTNSRLNQQRQKCFDLLRKKTKVCSCALLMVVIYLILKHSN